MKPQSVVTAKHKFQRFVFNSANQKLIDFLDELQNLAKDAFGFATQAIFEQILSAKMLPHLKKSINQANLENATIEQIMSILEKELELNGLEAPDQLQINTVTKQTTQQKPEKPKPICHHCKKPGHHRNQCRQLKQEKDPALINTNKADNNKKIINCQTNSHCNVKFPTNTNANNTKNQKDRRPRPVYPANRPPLRNRRPERQNQVQQRNAQSNSDGSVQAAVHTLN